MFDAVTYILAKKAGGSSGEALTKAEQALDKANEAYADSQTALSEIEALTESTQVATLDEVNEMLNETFD